MHKFEGRTLADVKSESDRVDVGVVKGLSHICITVSDMERAKNFYRVLLGWEEQFSLKVSGEQLEAMTGIRGSAGEVAGGAIGDNRLELICMNFIEEPSVRGIGLSRISFEVDSAAEAWARASEAGIVVTIEPREIIGCLIITVSDPDGTAIDLIEYLPGGGAWGGAEGRPQLRASRRGR
jgi:catechol 2,3-dioxygenase-like lactoylglutathione lyase family enzyme